MSSTNLLQFPLLQSHFRPPSTLLFPPVKSHLSVVSISFPTSQFLHTPSHAPPGFALMAKSPKNDTSEQKLSHEGSVVESLPNGMFRVRLDNEDLILGYISGKIRKNFVRILPGDRVRVEVSRYDSTKGRIVYRLRSSGKDSSS
ncbi:translation initiation factor IF-1 [Cucumis melo var. makuwa]|uniref:Translation initiation factor IF-1, chloroplastic n=2 Tax=Cucumis melo TaxID=3656 RepID=A0A5A7V7J3_CUCMM|nr:translation initiation factor IF-1, chloroplastic [Cucumis melo]KAA0064332.1 translation initiation factor IF-1 [Cucumis melo var. makuwa]TYK20254.1 translation initiation factor IF-1 [Cucumis melo var. makuwa]